MISPRRPTRLQQAYTDNKIPLSRSIRRPPTTLKTMITTEDFRRFKHSGLKRIFKCSLTLLSFVLNYLSESSPLFLVDFSEEMRGA